MDGVILGWKPVEFEGTQVIILASWQPDAFPSLAETVAFVKTSGKTRFVADSAKEMGDLSFYLSLLVKP